MSIGFKDFSSKIEHFLDLYDFLGVPPVSPPNLIYLAIQKIENYNFQQEHKILEEMKQYLTSARDRLLNTSAARQRYEEEWQSYYFPSNADQMDIEKLCSRNAQSRLLGGRLRKKSWPWAEKEEEGEEFDYTHDFLYFIMRDLPNDRDVFFLNPEHQIQLSPLEDTIFFEDRQFYLRSYGKLRVEVGNDALGKLIALQEKAVNLPLHIGDRIEFANRARLILRSVYSGRYADGAWKSPDPPLAFYFLRENVILPLQPDKIYILGRNTSDIHHLSFNEKLFCFVNIGRRERSISRQNFQVFFHQGIWYTQDLGSRYGTTLDFHGHFRFETLAGGSIMALEPGRIRLGYDKSYIIEVDMLEQCEKKRKARRIIMPGTQDTLTVYDIPLL